MCEITPVRGRVAGASATRYEGRLRRARHATLALLLADPPLAVAAAPFPPVFRLTDLEPQQGGEGSLGVFLRDPTPESFFGVAGTVDDVSVGEPQAGAGELGHAHVVCGRAAATEHP
jgi:hypothetical protein